MAHNSTLGAVDVAPFTARQEWASAHDYELWWEDPRDVFEVVAEFAPGQTPPPGEVSLYYWQQSWPRVRTPKGEDVGSGREGWLAIDDWTNGRWQPADAKVEIAGDALRLTFHPLDRQEFPDESGFPAVFRRTLKLRLHFDSPRLPLAGVRAFTDSLWRETTLLIEWKSTTGDAACWDGHLEAFNGYVTAVSPLEGAEARDLSGGWRSTVARDAADGVRATVRYAYNEDKNSYDRTIVTLRSTAHSFSFLVRDVLDAGPVYLRDFGAIVSRADAGVRLATFEKEWEEKRLQTLYQRVRDLPEQTWERAWADMPAKRRFYFVLGCEGGRQKFGVEPNGDIFLRENFIRSVPGRDTPRLGWDGRELRLSFGIPSIEVGDRSILDNHLPVVRTTWVDGDICYEQEAFAAWLFADMRQERPAGDEPVVAMVRIRLTNLASSEAALRLGLTSTVDSEQQERLIQQDGRVYAQCGERSCLRYEFDLNGRGVLRGDDGDLRYEVTLPAHGSHTLYVKIPFIALSEPEELARLRALSYPDLREQVVAFWRARIAQGAQIRTPNQTLNDFYRTHLMHVLVVNDREPGADRNVARCGGFQYGSFPDEGCMVISDLDRRGYKEEAERCLELYLHYQGTAPLPGNYQSAEGVFYGSGGYEVCGYNRNHGWVLWCLAEHYRYTRDRAWLERAAPAMVKGCDWVIRERQATIRLEPDGRRPIDYGFLPTGSLEDVTDYWTWLATNAYAYLGLRSAAEVLRAIGHPEGERLSAEARAYGDDLRAGFWEACVRSPVVRLRDGTWVPHFPPRQQRRGRDFGWLREVLEGAVHLIYCGLVQPDEPAARWIIEDYEDNLFLSPQYGYSAPDFERQWFSWGGFSMQPNLLIFQMLYLMRDEPKHFLRAFFNPFAAAFYPDTLMLTEHPLPTLADWMGDHFKTSDEALAMGWLRSMFLAEYGDELFVGQAIPRAWFEDGRTMSVERALTHFGLVSLEIVSCAATGTIVVKLDPPKRNPPRRIRVRVRHPERRPIRAVWINGLPRRAVELNSETITLEGCEECMDPLEIRVRY